MNDTVGKPFVVMSGGIRRCLCCDGLFTRQDAPVHAQVPCFLTRNASTEKKCELVGSAGLEPATSSV
jgi:hypothetical protein